MQRIELSIEMVSLMIAEQFPHWAENDIRPVATSGWDNHTFRLGDDKLLRFPSHEIYASQVAKEQLWLPRFASHLPLKIPTPIAIGEPSQHYPLPWSVYRWIPGEVTSVTVIADMNHYASKLAQFLKALQSCDTSGGPVAGEQNFHRGGTLKVYDTDTRAAIAELDDSALRQALTQVWDRALSSTWSQDAVWIHGDIAVNNLLLKNGELTAVIDFGQLAIGDPACDIALYWTFFTEESGDVFKQILMLDDNTWDRARGWVLWKTLCAPIAGTDCQGIIQTLLKR